MRIKSSRHALLLLLWLSVCLLTVDSAVSAVVTATAAQLWEAANSQWRQQRIDETLALLLQIQRANPEDPMLPMALGAVYQSKNDFERALQLYQSALPQLSRNADLHANIGQLFYQLKDMPQAIKSYRRAIALDAAMLPRTAHRLALAYHYNGEHLLAEKYYTAIAEKSAECHFDFAVTLERLGKERGLHIEQASREYNRALALDESLPQAWLNIAALHQQYGDVNASIPNYLRVLELLQTPPHWRLIAMTNLGVVYEVTEDIVSALEWFSQALQYISEVAIPQHSEDDRRYAYVLVLVHIARAKKTACVWEESERDFDQLLQLVLEHEISKGRPSALMPFDTLMHQLSPRTRKQIAMVHTNQFLQAPRGSDDDSATEPQQMPQLGTARSLKDASDSEEDSAKQLTVGYISYDFADHPTAHLLKGLFATSDKQRTKVVAFGYGRDDGSEIRKQIVDIVDVFEDIANRSIEKSVEVIRSRGVHILMDAQVHTRGSRMAIIARKPAPIVVNYLVYPGTSGAAFVDYLVTDRRVVPAELAADGFTEKLVFLPNSYQVNAYELSQSERAKLWTADGAAGDRGKEGEDAFVFVNFNKPDKIEPNVFAIWMAIMRRVPRSVLLLLDPGRKQRATVTSREIKDNIAREAEAQGVLRARIRFLPRIPKGDHLKRHNVNGLFLDTFIYGAHSTATDALYAGLPLLTLAGDSHASRVGISLLSNLDMDELVTFSRKEYEDLADCHAALQSKLRDEALVHPLFQTLQHTQALEASQRVMHDLHAAVGRPYHIALATGSS